MAILKVIMMIINDHHKNLWQMTAGVGWTGILAGRM